jgi:hypothetical protein
MTDNPVRTEVLLKVELVFSVLDEEAILFFSCSQDKPQGRFSRMENVFVRMMNQFNTNAQSGKGSARNPNGLS